jgi:hypothetical protein
MGEDTPSAVVGTTVRTKTPVASVTLFAGAVTGIAQIVTGYFDKTGLSRLLVETGAGTLLTSFAGTFLHQIGITKWVASAEHSVEDRFNEIDAEFTALWQYIEPVIEKKATPAVIPGVVS